MSELTIILNKLQDMEMKVDSLRRELADKSLKSAKEWLSIKEACEVANCSESKLRQLIDSGEVVSSKSGNKGALVVISRNSINKYFENKIYKPAYEFKKRV